MTIDSSESSDAIAKQTAQAKENDRTGKWNDDRNLMQYIGTLHGLEYLFAVLPSQAEVLFAGEGTGRELGELKRSYLARDGIHFTASTLDEPKPELVKNIGEENIYPHTNLAGMEGIPTGSKDAIISVHAAAYVDAPTFVRGVSRVLKTDTPTYFKGSFDAPDEDAQYANLGLQQADTFIEAFHAAGFEVDFMGTPQTTVIVAVRNGQPGDARRILASDEETETQQQERLYKAGFRLPKTNKYI